VRRARFVILAPDPRHLRRWQAEKPLIGLSEFPEPPLTLRVKESFDPRRILNPGRMYAGI
jgi:FAD/FMN-containing dehydrogenase